MENADCDLRLKTKRLMLIFMDFVMTSVRYFSAKNSKFAYDFKVFPQLKTEREFTHGSQKCFNYGCGWS